MKINNRVKVVYDKEFPVLIEKLKSMSKVEREELYKEYTKRLFPKSKNVVDLECLFSPRKDYKHKFKKCFLWVSNYMFSDYHFGEYYQVHFSEKTETSLKFPQKVVMSLSLMGYIDGVSMNYSYSSNKDFSHGYIYSMNREKLEQYWSMENTATINDKEKEMSDNHSLRPEYLSDDYKDWLVEKQHQTIMSIEVSPILQMEKAMNDRYIRNYNLERQEWGDDIKYEDVEDDYGIEESDYSDDEDVQSYKYEEQIIDDQDEKQERLRKYQLYQDYKYRAMNITNFMEKAPDTMESFTVDSYSGRFHSIMTRTRNDIRMSGGLTINGQQLCEVDISSSQPTLFGLLVKEKYHDIKSEWLEHCLSGVFYEWIIDVTGIVKFDKEKLKNSISWNDQARLCSRMDSDNPHIYLRLIVKFWIMKFLFGSTSIKSLKKNTGSCYKTFTSNLCKYLEENEPCLYDEFVWYRTHIEKVDGEKKSILPKHLQETEVRYIKECLKRLDPVVDRLYTVHDCVGCLECDAMKVKSIMEQTSLDMFGVKLNLKIESSKNIGYMDWQTSECNS